MESFDTLYLFMGAVAACIGIYMLITKKLVGRKEGEIPKKYLPQFVKLDAATYIVCGAISATLGLSSKIAFLGNTIVQVILIVAGVSIVFVNYLLGKKIMNK